MPNVDIEPDKNLERKDHDNVSKRVGHRKWGRTMHDYENEKLSRYPRLVLLQVMRMY